MGLVVLVREMIHLDGCLENLLWQSPLTLNREPPTRSIIILGLALVIVSSIPAVTEMQEENGMVSLWSKGAGWVLQLPGKGYKLQVEKHKEVGVSHYYAFHNSDFSLNVSFFIEPVDECTSSEERRKQYWQNPGPVVVDPQKVTFFDLNGFSVVEFVVPMFKGMKVDQMNMSAHHVREGFWVDTHISKVLYQPKDRATFIEFIKSIRFKTQG